MPLKAVTIGAVRSWANPHTMKQLVNSQNGRIMFLSISGSFFTVIRIHLLRWRARLTGKTSRSCGPAKPTTQQILLPQIHNARDGFDCADESRVGVVRIIPGVKRAYGPGPALGISRPESSIGVGHSATPPVTRSGLDTRWARTMSGTATLPRSMRSGSRRVTDHLLAPGLGANWPRCQIP